MKAYSREQLLETEQNILQCLEWQLCTTSSWTYLQRYCSIDGCSQTHLYLARYFIEECMISYKLVEHTQHKIACAALYLANRFFKRQQPWPAALERASGFKESDLRLCTKVMCSHLKKCKGMSTLSSVKRKFSSEEFLGVALLPNVQRN